MKKISLLLALFPMFFYGQSITFSTVGSTNYVFPAGVTPITVQAWGGGGGGGGSTVPGLNVERAGAGGGGGAFASQTFTIPSGATLSVVVGAGGSGVISGNGTNGSFSTITGYTGSIYAVGGAGGTANTAGGNPAGGAGGTALASTGATKFDGAKGVDGQTGLLITSGAGGQGGNGGGAGGVGVATLLGSTSGNAGAVPGGGGSGSISPLVLGSNRGGGPGGSGRVIISYTCPTYSLTSTAGSIVNLCSGTSSIITLTGNLPVGLYKVSYQVGGVAQTAVNMSVTTTGTGSFIAPGFTTLGNKTVTITNLTSGTSATSSENCSSTISSGNTAVITTTSSGTAPVAVAASGATCTQSTLNWLAVPGATSYEFDLSTDINFGSFLFNSYNVGAALGAVITGLTTNTTYYYRVRSYTTPCVSVNSNTITFKTPIVPSVVTAVAATNVVCSVFNANWNAEVNSTSYLLDVSTSSLFGSFVTGFNGLDVGNVTTYTVTGLTAGTTYYYRVRGKNGCGTGTSSTTQTVATVNTMPGTVTATAATNAICKVFNANWNAGSLATSYLLDVATTSAFTAGTFVGSFNGFDVGNVTTYSVPVPTSGGTYYYRIKGKNGCGNSASFSNVITVTTSSAIPVAPTGVVSSNIWCTQFTMSWNSTVNALAYDVQISTSAAFPATSATQTYTDITTTNHTFTGLTAGTNYYYKVLAKNGCGSSTYGVPSPAFITTTAIPVTPTISPSGSVNFCQTSSLVLTSSANTNNVWSTGETTKTITVTSAGSYTVKVVNTGGCDSALSLPTTIIVDGLPTASTAGGSQTICANGSAIISGASATNGSILWTINGGSGTLTNATTLTPTYTPSLGGPARAIVLTMTVTSNNTCTPQTAMDTYTVNIQAAPTAVSSGSQIICPNGSATVSGAAATNGSILWTHNGSGSLTNQTTETPTYTAVPADTGNVVTLTMTVTATPACTTPYTATATYPITVNAINTVGSAAVPPSFCINSPMSNITRTTTGATGISNDGIAGANGLPTGVSATWVSNTITISGTPTASGTFNYSIPLTGGCGTVNATGSFIVNSTPQGSLTANGPFCTSGTGQLTFTASAGTGPYTIIYNDGTADRTATNITSGTAFAPFTSTVNSTTTYTLVSVTGATCVRSTGFTVASATITVNSVPQGSLTANGPFCTTGAGQLTFTATAGTGPYTVVYNDGTANQTATNVISGTPFATFTTPVTSTTTYTLVSVTGATCVRSTGFTGASATITVNSVPQGILTANGPFCTTGAGQLTFTATAGTGPYTVVYNDGTANQTATNVISGTPFTTFTTPVTSTTTYTLVSVTGATCVRNSGFTGASATITVNSVPQGSLTANGPFCTTGAGQLTFTATAGTGPYTVVYNDGTANQTATNVISGTPFATFTTPVTSTTTYTLVSVTGATCIRNSGFTGASATITVNSVPQGSLTTNGPFCTSGTEQLTFTASAGTGPYTIVYNDGTADRTATNITSGTAFAPFTSTINSTTTYTLVSVTGATCIRNSGFTGASATITVNSVPQGSLTANGPFCTSGTGQLTFTASAGTGPYTIVYNDGTADRTATNITSGTAFATFTTPVTSTTTYTLVSVTGATCVRNTGFIGSSATITVNSVPQGSLTANGPFCTSGTGQLTFTASAGTGPYTIIYNDGTADRTATNITSGTAFAPFTSTVNSTTTYTLVSVTGATCVRNTGFAGSSATITVNSIPQGSLTSNGPFCTSGTGQLTFTASAGTGPYTIVYNDGTADRTATNITSGTAFAPFTSTVNSTTTYTLVSVTGSTCVRNTGFTGSSATITVNSVPQGSLTANGPFCATGSGQLTFTVTAGTGPYIVIYSDGTANRTANNVTSGTAFATFTTPVTSTTTYTLVSVTGANSCLRSTGFTGGSATITVNPIPVPTFSDQPGATVCVNTNVTYTTLSGQTNYIWTVPGVANTDYTIISGGISSTDNTVTLQWLTAGNKTVTTSYSSTGCAAVTNASNTTAVTKTDRGAVNGGLHICSGDPSPLLTLHNYVGTIVRWEYAEAIPYVWQPINNTTDTYQPGILTTSTSYRAVVKSGTCPEEFAIETRINVDTKPSTPVTGTIIQPTCINPTGSIALSGLLAAANWTITQSGTVYQTYSSTGTNFTIPNLVPGNYTFTIHENSSCPSLPTVSIEIKAAITNAWNGTTWSKGSPPINTDVIEFSGNYQTTGDLSGCSCIVDPGVNVTVNSGHTLTITNSVSNNGGILTFENNASLLQINDAINTGNIIYKRNTTAVRRYDFTHWSSPVTRTPDYTLHDLSPLTLGDKYYKYDQSNGWVIIYNGSAPMEKGIGYIVRAPQNYDIDVASVFNAVFTGVPNNGPVAVNLVGAEKWSLIGNPYPSAVYADQFIFDNSANLYGTLYFWTHNTKPSKAIPGDAVYNYTNDDYAIYNLTGSTNIGGLVGTGATTPGNQTAPSGYIAAGVSFFAKSKTGLNAIFTNSMRVSGHNSQFYKSDNVAKTNIERHRLWLNLTNTGGAFKQLLIGYVENATNSWDNNYDAVTLDGNKYLDFYSINEDRKLVIQARALPFVESDSIPLGYRSTIAGDFTIAIDHADGNLTNQPIYIKDKVTGELHDLRASNYTFTTATGTFLDRFVLRYTNKTLGVGDIENTDNTIFTSVKDKIIKLTSTKEAIAQVVIYDASGKLLYDKKKIGTTDLQIQNLQSGNQVLFIKVTLENGNITTRKIIF